MNRGKLCPKGLSEHYTIEADNRAKHPLLRKNGKLVPRRLGRGARHDGGAVSRCAGPTYGPEALGVTQHRPAGHRRVLHARQAGRSSASAQRTTTATPRCAWPARSRATSGRSAATALRALRGSGAGRCHPADRRQHRRQPSDPLPAPGSESEQKTLIVADPRVTKTAMMADLHLPSEAALGSRAAQRIDSHPDRTTI